MKGSHGIKKLYGSAGRGYGGGGRICLTPNLKVQQKYVTVLVLGTIFLHLHRFLVHPC